MPIVGPKVYKHHLFWLFGAPGIAKYDYSTHIDIRVMIWEPLEGPYRYPDLLGQCCIGLPVPRNVRPYGL